MNRPQLQEQKRQLEMQLQLNCSREIERIKMQTRQLFPILVLLLVKHQLEAATLVYHRPTAMAYPQPVPEQEQQHPGYTIVAPLTKIAHVTYDSVPISHTPFEHVPLFQRIGHVKSIGL
ncbi:uncharacterized protein LOC117786917 [Drosophila innubila]|uniref:uncharacterized protein LOC117786917 n=1 Tax=Drosophila innubila TaxID=198719 RepID=UPI00148CB69E|nr:uncharacterized protein LOC117786917 [Drosophila innubila]